MKQNIVVLFILLIVATSVGCGKSTVSGKVTFPDGSPLNTGEVIMESHNTQYRGKIQSDGSYSMGITGEGGGIPKGDYKVCLEGTDQTVAIDSDGNVISWEEADRNRDEIQTAIGGMKAPIPTRTTVLVDPQYLSVNSSGLTCTVTGSMKYDIKVEPPKE